MQIFKLNSAYMPDLTLNRFKDFVWTERYKTAGDFQIVVENDVAVLTRFPVGTLISHTDTLEVMMIENHEIVRDSTKKLKITMSGRSIDTFAENRTTMGTEQPLTNVADNKAIVETITAGAEEVIRQLLVGRLQPGIASASDAIPNLTISSSVRVPDAAKTYTIQRGDIYGRVMELAGVCDVGFKTIRPNGAQTGLVINIHDGIDRSATVIFYAQNEDLEDAKYFWSNKGYKNYANVNAKFVARTVRTHDLGADVTGFSKRTMYVEASDLDATSYPGGDTDPIGTRGQSALDENKKVELVSAKISVTAKPKFKFQYGIGDLVLVFGEFSTTRVMRVAEHILTVDDKGIQGYPSLAIP